MAQSFPLPKWGLTMEEGTIVEWQVEVGSKVREGQVLGVVATDKIEVDFESPVSGVVAAYLSQPGEDVAVGTDVVVIASDQDDYSAYEAANAG